MKRQHNYEASNSSDRDKHKKQHHGFTSVFRNSTVEARQHSRILTNVLGEIKLVGAPHHGLVLDSRSDVIPLIPVDSARYLVDWISSVGHRVMIKQLLAVSEDFQILREGDSTEYRNYIVKWENIKILEENEINPNYHLNNSNEILETNENTTVPETLEAKDIVKSQRTCHVVVHHVSTPFHVGGASSASCLVFISYTKSNRLETKLWLVLQQDQVAWREFLVPNREYLLHFPPGTDRFFFDKFQKPLDTFLEKSIREIRVMLHHKMLFSNYSMLNGSIVPPGTKVYLSRNSSFSDYINRFTADLLWFGSWFSTSEADHASAPLVTFYGKVSSVEYLEEEVYKSCYLCIQKEPRDPQLKAPKYLVPQVWMDPFKSHLELGENLLIELPRVTENENSLMKTGVPGRLVQVIKLQDLLTGEERSIYIKHSYVSNCQQMIRLAADMCVCLSHLNRRCSTSGNYYYITTVLTSCRVLDYNNTGQREGWGLYGLQDTRTNPQMKTWGVLEPFNVTKVAIRAKCNYCGALFFQRCCSNFCAGTGTYTASAHAVVWINVVHDNKSITMEKVLIKDDLVRKLLGIPEKMWSMLEEAAAQEEIVAFRDQVLDESSFSTPLRRSFQLYCSVKSREKFYISVKKLPCQDAEDLYYCINLEPINKERLNIVAGLVAKEVT